MANSLCIYYSSFATVSGDTTDFCNCFITADNFSTETGDGPATWRSPGTLSNFWGRITANSVSISTTHRIRRNLANGNQTFSVNASTSGTFTDATHTDTVSSGNTFDIAITLNGNAGTLIPNIYSCIFAATTDTVTRCSLSNFDSGWANSTTYYSGFAGSDEGSLSTNEANAKIRMRKAATIKNMAEFIDTNGNANSVTLKSRKNGADGNLIISITSSTTGLIEDTTHSDSVAIGDDINRSYTIGTGTLNFTPAFEQADYDSTTSDTPFIASSTMTSQSFNHSITVYNGIAGDLVSTSTTESTAQAQVNDTFKFSELLINVRSNTITSSSTLTLRTNGGSSGVTLSIGSSATGVITDSVHTYTAASTDLMNYQLVTGSAGTSMTVSQMSVWGTKASAVGPTIFAQNFKNLPPNPNSKEWQLLQFQNNEPVFGI